MALGLSFVWLFGAILLTGARDIPEFNQADWVVFGAMLALEVPTVIAEFVFAVRCGKGNLQFEKRLYEVRRSIMESTPLFLGKENLLRVFTDSECTERITLYSGFVSGEENAVCFITEVFNQDYVLTVAYRVNYLVDEFFAEEWDLPDITDKFINV